VGDLPQTFEPSPVSRRSAPAPITVITQAPPRAARPAGRAAAFVVRVLVALQIAFFTLWTVAPSWNWQVADYVVSGACGSKHSPRQCQDGVPASSWFGDALRFVAEGNWGPR